MVEDAASAASFRHAVRTRRSRSSRFATASNRCESWEFAWAMRLASLRRLTDPVGSIAFFVGEFALSAGPQWVRVWCSLAFSRSMRHASRSRHRKAWAGTTDGALGGCSHAGVLFDRRGVRCTKKTSPSSRPAALELFGTTTTPARWTPPVNEDEPLNPPRWMRAKLCSRRLFCRQKTPHLVFDGPSEGSESPQYARDGGVVLHSTQVVCSPALRRLTAVVLARLGAWEASAGHHNNRSIQWIAPSSQHEAFATRCAKPTSCPAPPPNRGSSPERLYCAVLQRRPPPSGTPLWTVLQHSNSPAWSRPQPRSCVLQPPSLPAR